MELNVLLEKFIQTIMDSLDVDRVCLVGSRDKVNQILAVAARDQLRRDGSRGDGSIAILPAIALADYPHLPHDLIQRVVQSAAMVIDQMHMVIPIVHQNHPLFGVLSLELSVELSPEQVRLIQGLCGQLAISLTQIFSYQRLLTYTENLEAQIPDCIQLPQSPTTTPENLPIPPSLTVLEMPEVALMSANRVIRLSEHKFRQLVENANDLIFTITLDGRFTYLSPKFREMCGYEPTEFIHRSFALLAHPDDVAGMYAMLRGQLLKRDKLTDFECRICHKAGHYIWITSNHSAPIEDENGNLIGFQGIVRDITDRKQAEAKLQAINEQLLISNAELARATRLKDEFLANMSHELRTPLNSILGIAEAMLEQPYGQLSPRYQKSIRMIETSGGHLLDLINDILDLAKIEAGKLELQVAETSVQQLCQSSINFVKQLALNKGLKLDYQILMAIDDRRSHEDQRIVADERRLRQVLINLLSNAVKFTPSGGTIELLVETDRTAEMLLFHVKDTGIGIAADLIPQLFQPFMQIDSSLSRQYSGTGLGLALVKRIINLHGGSIQVMSREHQGSCFTIGIPCVMVDQPSDRSGCDRLSPLQLSENCAPMPTQSPNHNSPLVLLAEDNKMNIEMFTDYLDLHGYQLVVAQDGVEAVEIAKAQQPHLILMDIQMPKMDGLEAIRQIRQEPRLATTPIIALTALAMPGDAQKCLEVGANNYLAKPVKLKELVNVMRTLLPPSQDVQRADVQCADVQRKNVAMAKL
jgi:PAS domain S-box-containing protein